MPNSGKFLFFLPAREIRFRDLLRALPGCAWRVVVLLLVLLLGAVVSFFVVVRDRFFWSGGDNLFVDIFGDQALCAVIVVSAAYLLIRFKGRRLVLKRPGLKFVLARMLLCVASFFGKVAVAAVAVIVVRVLYFGMYTSPFLRDYGVCIVGDGQDGYYTFSAVRCVSREHLEFLFSARSSEIDTDPPANITYSRMSDGRMKIYIEAIDKQELYATWVFDPRSGKLSFTGGVGGVPGGM